MMKSFFCAQECKIKTLNIHLWFDYLNYMYQNSVILHKRNESFINPIPL